jgi:hypothetical protein
MDRGGGQSRSNASGKTHRHPPGLRPPVSTHWPSVCRHFEFRSYCFRAPEQYRSSRSICAAAAAMLMRRPRISI